LAAIVVIIIFVGVYPKPVLNLTKETADFLLTQMSYKQ